MKSVLTKVGAAALIGVVLANAFVPCASALDIVPPSEVGSTETIGVIQPDEYFALESKILDFGRVTELGRSYTKSVVVNNNTANDVIIDVLASKYTEVAEDNQKLTGWIAFVGGITHFNISAGSSRDINVRVVVPTDAPAGTQYANVELVDAGGHKEVALIKVDIAGEDLKYSSEVIDAMITPVRLDDILEGKATVKNTGTAGFVSVYQIRAKNLLGGTDWTVVKEVSEEVFPGKQVEFSTNDALGFGIYTVEQRVTFANEEGRMVESFLSRTVVNLPWWGVAAAGGAIVLIVLIVVIVKIHKHRRRNSDTLKRAERKARKAEIARVERAEKKALKKDGKTTDDANIDEALDAVEEFSAAEKEDGREIRQIAQKLEAEEVPEQPTEGEKAVPIKVTVKKKSNIQKKIQ